MSLNQLWQHDLTLVVYQADTSRNDTWQLSMSSGIRSWEADVPFESMGCSCWGLLKLNLFINQKQVESWRLKHTHVLQWVQSFRPAMYSHTSANAGNAFVSPNKFALLGREWKWLNYSFAWKDFVTCNLAHVQCFSTTFNSSFMAVAPFLTTSCISFSLVVTNHGWYAGCSTCLTADSASKAHSLAL